MNAQSVSGNSMLAAGQYQVAVAKKALDSAEVQGRQSLQLIQSAGAPANVSQGVGTHLNITA